MILILKKKIINFIFIFFLLLSFLFSILFFYFFYFENNNNFEKIPVLIDGRIKPINSLKKTLFNKSNLRFDNKNQLLQKIIFDFENFKNLDLFIINDKNILINLDLNIKKKYSFNEIFYSIKKNYNLINSIIILDYDNRSVNQNNLLEFYYSFFNIFHLKDYFKNYNENNIFYLVYFKKQWFSPNILKNDNFIKSNEYIFIHEILKNYNKEIWKNNCKNYYKYIFSKMNNIQKIKVQIEYIYNEINFVFLSFLFYFFSLLIIFLKKKIKIDKLFKLFIFFGFILHFLEIFFRVLFTSRAPITNLYESIVFVNIVMIVIFIFFYIKKKINEFILLGIILLQYIAYKFNMENGIENLVPILNTNFWLITHVITITLGYVFCLFSGFLAHFYLYYKFKNNFYKLKLYFNYIHFLIILALFFSFSGTILGGIWADQSWGRFWGWDPKENGALFIILWISLLLHLRNLKNFKSLYFIFGIILNNIVVSISWFGINLLNIGLHSYGFTKNIGYFLILFLFFEIFYIFYFFLLIKNKKY